MPRETAIFGFVAWTEVWPEETVAASPAPGDEARPRPLMTMRFDDGDDAEAAFGWTRDR